MTPTRRDFLGVAASAVGLAALGCARRDEPATPPPPDLACTPAPGDVGMPVFPLALGEWSLHRMIRAGQLDPLDFAAFARERFRIEAVDHVSQFFADRAHDAAYFREMRRRADDAGVRSLLVLIDLDQRLGASDPAKRAIAVHEFARWLEPASILGCRGIRVDAYGDGTPDEQIRTCAEGIYRLADLADPYGLDVLVENHGGLSSRGDWLAPLVHAVAHPRVGSLPDFGNWDYAPNQWYDRYCGVQQLMPYARAVSAKAHDFDANGEETSTDFEGMLRIVAAAGYDDYLEVEYEGDRLSEEDGIRATIQLIRRVSPAD